MPETSVGTVEDVDTELEEKEFKEELEKNKEKKDEIDNADDESGEPTTEEVIESAREQLQAEFGDDTLVTGESNTYQWKRSPDGKWSMKFDGKWSPVEGDGTDERLEQLQAGPDIGLSENGKGGFIEMVVGEGVFDAQGSEIFTISSTVFTRESVLKNPDQSPAPVEAFDDTEEESMLFPVEEEFSASVIQKPLVQIELMQAVVTNEDVTEQWSLFESPVLEQEVLSSEVIATDEQQAELVASEASSPEVALLFPETVEVVQAEQSEDPVIEQSFAQVVQELQTAPPGTKVHLAGPRTPDGMTVTDVTTLTVHEPGRISYSFAELPEQHAEQNSALLPKDSWEVKAKSVGEANSVNALSERKPVEPVSPVHETIKIIRLESVEKTEKPKVVSVAPVAEKSVERVYEATPNPPEPSPLPVIVSPAAPVIPTVEVKPSEVYTSSPSPESGPIVVVEELEKNDTHVHAQVSGIHVERVVPHVVLKQVETDHAPEPVDSPDQKVKPEVKNNEPVIAEEKSEVIVVGASVSLDAAPRVERGEQDEDSVFIESVTEQKPVRLRLDTLRRPPVGLSLISDDEVDVVEDEDASPVLPSSAQVSQRNAA